MITLKRPHFDSPEQWHEHAKQCFAEGRSPWSPETREELLLAAREYPERVEWRPADEWLDLMGLPRTLWRPASPLPREFYERFFEGVNHGDPEVRDAMKKLVGA
jgi:hypothetical protein